MKINMNGIADQNAWKALDIGLPKYEITHMAAQTKREPIWIHFGAGNIFRAFIAVLQQRLLNDGFLEKGIIVAETFDDEIIDKIYTPHDNLALNVVLNADGNAECEVVASIAEAVDVKNGRSRLTEIFTQPSLQIASFTITEKGYALYGLDGGLLPIPEEDIKNGPEKARHAISLVTALLLARYKAGKFPLALVSMDNCSHNGDLLQSAILEIARRWITAGYADDGFTAYLSDDKKISFPWSMIDKITPGPAQAVKELLAKKGIEGVEPIVTAKGTYIAAFVNAERPEYLVIEDNFPNGRPPLEKVGVYITDRETVNKTERMKVTACLNPLHTAMGVYGCLLGYKSISDEMNDTDITALIKRLGYVEGLPILTDPVILSPRKFLDEVVNERLPNPFIPDTPERIVIDHSQKVGVRFGETIKFYISENRDLSELVAIPLAIAGWFRYLLGVDDWGKPIEISTDPLKDELTARLSGVIWNEPSSYRGELISILSNSLIFGSDLTQTILSERIEIFFISLLAGAGAVRKTLHDAITHD